MKNIKIPEISYQADDETYISYPTEEEMEAMYEEFLKNGSFTEVFDDDPF